MAIQVKGEISTFKVETAFDTVWLEGKRGKWNSGSSGEMRRYPEERQ